MKTAFDTARLKQNTNLIDLAGRYIELRKVTPKEYHGPCPWCGGDDRFRVTAEHFACRQCGRKGDAIEFIMLQHNVDFKAAVSILGGDMPTVSDKVKPVSKQTEPAYQWDEEAKEKMALQAHAKLIAQQGSGARQCMAYLNERGIEPATVKAFTVGYATMLLPGTWDDGKATHPRQLAISLPWFNHDGALVAVKYRFTESHTYTDEDGKPRTENKTSRGTVKGNVFGWQALQGPDKCDVLIICEGEMNALSLWQAGAGAIDVLSPGSESMAKVLPPIVITKAAEYKHKIVWADKKAIADAAAAQIGAASVGSPKGMDANDLLKAGKLRAFLVKMLGRMGATLPEMPVDTPLHTPTSHTDVLPPKGDDLYTLTFEDKEQPLQPVDGFPDIHTADIYSFMLLNLFTDELEILRTRCAGRFDVDAVHIGSSEDGDLWKVKRISPAGKPLWRGKAGYYVA